jgi:hypothetical protein
MARIFHKEMIYLLYLHYVDEYACVSFIAIVLKIFSYKDRIRCSFLY